MRERWTPEREIRKEEKIGKRNKRRKINRNKIEKKKEGKKHKGIMDISNTLSSQK